MAECQPRAKFREMESRTGWLLRLFPWACPGQAANRRANIRPAAEQNLGTFLITVPVIALRCTALSWKSWTASEMNIRILLFIYESCSVRPCRLRPQRFTPIRPEPACSRPALTWLSSREWSWRRVSRAAVPASLPATPLHDLPRSFLAAAARPAAPGPAGCNNQHFAVQSLPPAGPGHSLVHNRLAAGRRTATLCDSPGAGLGASAAWTSAFEAAALTSIR